MEKHAPGIIPITASRMLERAGFYGMRAILMLHITRGALHIPMEEAAGIYGWFIGISGFLPVLGGLLGDLLLGSRRASITGGFMQAAGCFALCLPGAYGLYAGLILIATGLGMFQPNIVSMLGLLYKDRPRLMDSAMTIVYMSLIFGAFTGAFFITSIADEISYDFAFMASGILIAAAQLLLILPRKSLAAVPYMANRLKPATLPAWSPPALLPAFISLFLLVPAFWVILDVMSARNMELMLRMSIEGKIPGTDLQAACNILNPVVMVIGGVILAAAWSFIDASPFLKLATGFFIFSVVAIMSGLMQVGGLLPAFLLGGVALEVVAELFISPTALSVICRYASPRWISTLTGAYFTSSTLLSHAASFLITFSGGFSSGALYGAATVILLAAAALYLLFYLLIKRGGAGNHPPSSMSYQPNS